jgi:hypothetical protein
LDSESTHAAATSDVARILVLTMSRTVSSNAHPLGVVTWSISTATSSRLLMIPTSSFAVILA